MSEMTAEQVKAHHDAALGPEMGPVYNRLWNETVQLRWEWKEFRTLFAQRQERIDALNEAASAFFFLVQHALEQHVISSIANLTDSPATGRNPPQPNLTIRRLPILAKAIDPGFGDELETLVAAGDASWLPIRNWRHKHLAHLDLDVALDRRATPLRAIGVAEVDAALAALREVLMIVEKRCSPDADVSFDIVGRHGGAETLLYLIERTKRFEDEQMERIRTGRALPEDLNR